MEPVFYIIEHPTRGVLRDTESDWRGGKMIMIPRFSATGARNGPNSWMFRSQEDAQRTLDSILKSGGPSEAKCRIRRTPEYEALCPECGNWTNRWFDHDESCSVYKDEVKRHGN